MKTIALILLLALAPVANAKPSVPQVEQHFIIIDYIHKPKVYDFYFWLFTAFNPY